MTEQDVTGPKPIVRVQDIRAARICFQGERPWFRRRGFSWQSFLTDGIEAEVLEATGDALAFRVTAVARTREACRERDK